MHDELLQCFDEQGNPTETHLRSEVKQSPPRWWYGVVRVFLVNSQGHLMCSKRAESVSANPGTWQIYFGGHVGAGESFSTVAARELEEEAGLALSPDQLSFVMKGAKPEKLVHYQNFVAQFDGAPSDLHFVDNEVSEAHWMDIGECLKDLREHPETWSSACTVADLESLQTWLANKKMK